MESEQIIHFLPSEQIFKKAKMVFKKQKRELEMLSPEADIQHVGSCSVPGAIGKFDIDIQVRVTTEMFNSTVTLMMKHYQPKHPEIWTEEFAVFSNDKNQPIDIIVTIIGSKKDDFYRVRDTLIANKKLLEEYNNFKKNYEGKTYGEYREAKNNFFGGNGNVWFLKY